MVADSETPLIQCRVLYIGSAVPLLQAKGIEAIQQPLRERYLVGDGKSISGVDAILSVLPPEIQMTYTGDTKTVVSFPISTLTFCAAVRCIHLINNQGKKVPRFISLNLPEAGGINAHRPSIFAAITRRMKGRKVLECHGFLCASPSDAKNLVQAAKMADRAYRSGLGMNSFNPIYSNLRANTLNARPVTEAEVHLIPADQRSTKSEVPQEFFDVPPRHGYFYSAGADNVKSYTVERVTEGPPNEALPNGTKTMNRPIFRTVAPFQPRVASIQPMIPAHAPYVRHVAPITMKKGGPIAVNTLPPPRRFLSPPPQSIMTRNGTRMDPYIYRQPRIATYPPYAYGVPFQPPKDRSPSSCESSESGETPKATLGRSNSESRTEGAAVTTNGNDAGSSSDSSRPHSPPRDYDAFIMPDGRKSRLSRREQYELQKKGAMPPRIMQPFIYPYNPYIYPAYYVARPVPTRPRSLPPPMENKSSSKVWRKKDKKSKKKSKGKTSEDMFYDQVEYHSDFPSTENYIRSSIDRTRTFQNEKAFARSIAEEQRRKTITQMPTAYGQSEEKDFLY